MPVLTSPQVSRAPKAGRSGLPDPARAARRRSAAQSVALYLVTLVAIVTVVFLIPRAMPGDPISARQDPDSSLYVDNDAVRQRMLAYYGLDRPLVSQYVSYLGRVARGDLGWSISRNVPVRTLIGEYLPWTLLLMGTALAISSLLSFFAGVGAAWHRGKRRDTAMVVTMTGTRAIPEYALAAVLLVLFAVVVPVFPLYGAQTPFNDYSTLGKVEDIARHMALPVTALVISLVGTKFLLVRNTMSGVLGQDYMVFARAKGLPPRKVKFHHAARNAMLPFLTVLGIQVAFAVGGSVFVESVFAYPGMGTLILKAVETRDYPVLEGSFLALATTVLLVNLAIELFYARLDPRAGKRRS